MAGERLETSGPAVAPRPPRIVPVVVIAPTVFRLPPSGVTDAATKAIIDGKLNAALKELIKQAIGSSGPAVEAFVDALPLDYNALLDQSVLSVIRSVVAPAMQKDPALAGLGAQLATRPEAAGTPRLISLLQPDVPLAQHPLFVADVRQSKARELLRITNLNQDLVDKVDAGQKQLETWNDLDWDKAVQQQILTPVQRDDLRFSTELSRLTGEQYGLVEAARKGGVNTTADLIKLDQAGWLGLIAKNPTAIPDGVAPAAYAATLAKTVSQTYPSEFFAARIADKTVAQRLPQGWSQAAALLPNNPDLLQRLDVADLDWTGVAAAQQPALASQLREVATLVNTYRHLGLADLLADARTTPVQKTAEIGRRIDLLGHFLQNNAAEDLRYLNLLAPAPAGHAPVAGDGHVDWSGIAAADQVPVRNQMLAYQRVLHLSRDHDTARALLGSGLDASAGIANLSYSGFRRQTGLDDASAAPVYRRAVRKAEQITNYVQLQKDATSTLEQGRYFQGINPSFVNDLKDLPGYADLFGNTSYCDCEHCRSIFSPAAYFTDLMYFIDKNITKYAFAGKKKHPLRLNMRRPDLWHLPLTCANTDTLIPHLTLVIEILESYLGRTLSIKDVPQTLASDRSAIGLPYHVPLATMREYLRDWNLGLADVYQLLNVPLDTIYRETLRLSDGEWTALVTAAPLDAAWIKFPSSDHSHMDVADDATSAVKPSVSFLRFAGIGRDALGELQATKTAGGFSIVRVALSDDIQSEKEVVQGLTDARLDRIGRFLRLARGCGYTLIELDELLQTPHITDAQPFSPKSLTGLARFKRLGQSLGLSVEALIGVLDHIPTRPMKSGATSLADQLGVGTLTGTGGFPVAFHHAHFNADPQPDATVDQRLPALLNVTGLVESDLLALFALYPTAFPFDSHGNCQLKAANVALLYAHATLARVWRITPSDLGLIVSKLLQAPGNDFRSLELLEVLQRSVALLKSLPLAVTDAFALTDPATAAVTIDQVVAAVQGLQQSGARRFGPIVLTSIPNVKADDAAAILTPLVQAGLLEQAGDKYALTAAYTPSTDLSLILSPPPASVADIHAALIAFHFINLLPNALAATTGMDVDRTVVAFAFAQPGWDAPAMLTALTTPITNGVATNPADLQPLLTLANDLTRLAQLFSALGVETADCWFIAQYPAIFGISDIRALRIPDLAAIRRYRQLRSGGALTAAQAQNLLWQYKVRANPNQPIAPAQPFGNAAAFVPVFSLALNSPDHAPLTPAAPPAFLSEALVPSPLNADEIALVAKGNSLDATLLRSLFLSQPLGSNALDGIGRALQLYAFCQSLGIQGPSLAKLLPRDFAGLGTAADLLLGLLQAKYRDQAARDKNILPHTEALNMLRRDALCDFIIARADLLNFRSHDDLYGYFLIDVAMGGCFETSRIVAALSSLQLYVYRCLVDLEQSQSDGLSVLSLIHADDIRKEWEWRRNYRVWEANRKVFVYPENYIEPELRDDKTLLFEDLEDDLLQRKITLDAAEQAYHDYLSGFSTLAQLEVAGVCFDDTPRDDDPDGRYWFVARSHTDPYQYCLRCYHVHADHWDSWESIDVGISAPYVSPLVHLGRLYLFWVEIKSMEKTEFVDGNSIFRGIEHQVILHYSYREKNGKWAAQQKQVLIDKLVDRAVTNLSPPFLQLLGGVQYFVIDKAVSEKMADQYRASKTYAKVIATADDDTTLTLHYFRSCQRTAIWVYTPPTDPQAEGTIAQVPDVWIDRVAVTTPQGTNVLPALPAPPAPPLASIEYFRAELDLVLNQLSDLEMKPTKPASDGSIVPDIGDFPGKGKTPEDFYNGGTEAIGIFYTPDPSNPDRPDPTKSYLSLMLRDYAQPDSPAATDAMLITTN